MQLLFQMIQLFQAHHTSVFLLKILREVWKEKGWTVT